MDVPAPSEVPNPSAHTPASIESSEPAVNGTTPGEDPKVATTNSEKSAREPGVITNGVAASKQENGTFAMSNGVHDVVVSEVEERAKPIRDSGIGFVNGEDSTNHF